MLGALLAALSIAFCELLHATPRLYAKFFPNPYLRVVAGGILIIALTKLLGTTDYNGAGSAVIAAAMAGQALPWAFALKMLFTALTLGAGYKGGEIVPIFFTGATFGCAVAPLLGLPAPLGAALGMVALFCGCTNSPLASICLGLEVFGGQCLPLFALACAVAYMLSSYFSLYHEQHFLLLQAAHRRGPAGGWPLGRGGRRSPFGVNRRFPRPAAAYDRKGPRCLCPRGRRVRRLSRAPRETSCAAAAAVL